MADKKYQVFISSPYRDLIEERRDIAKSVLDLGHIPAAMENFPAIDEEQLRYIKRIIDQCDYYVLVVAGKYGSVDEDGISYTQKEYEYAIQQGKFVLAFPFHDVTKLTRDRTEEDPVLTERLKNFRKTVMAGRLVRPWTDRANLDNVVTKALSVAFNEFPQSGWVRTPKSSNEDLLNEINELRKDNAKLTKLLKNAEAAPIAQFEGMAGLGERYTFQIISRDRNLLNRGVSTFSMTVTWSEILLAFCFATKGVISSSDLKIGAATRFMSILQFNSMNVPLNYHITMDDHHFERMLVQLTALGYIEEAKPGLYKITPSGKKFYTEQMIVRK